MELPWRLFTGILALWILVGVVPFVFLGDLHAAAEFANAFGFVNALFAALAFGGVVWAIRLQTKELELQRSEIEETRDELRRSADAQTLSLQMHLFAALLTARNNVAQGYAVAAERESGVLRPNQAAHHQHLVELEWLLREIDRHPSNSFAIPPLRNLVAHQLELLLRRSRLPLQIALANRATNHARSLLLELNQALRDLRRLLAGEPASDLSYELDESLRQAEAVSTAGTFDEVGPACQAYFDRLARQLTIELGAPVPPLSVATDSQPSASGD